MSLQHELYIAVDRKLCRCIRFAPFICLKRLKAVNSIQRRSPQRSVTKHLNAASHPSISITSIDVLESHSFDLSASCAIFAVQSAFAPCLLFVDMSNTDRSTPRKNGKLPRWAMTLSSIKVKGYSGRTLIDDSHGEQFVPLANL